jgi:prevent-host-death family protein
MYAVYHIGMEPKRMGTRELRDNLSVRIDAAYVRHEPTIVTRNGRPRAVLISYEEWLMSQARGRDQEACTGPP